MEFTYNKIIHNIDFFENNITKKFKNNTFSRTLKDYHSEKSYERSSHKIKAGLH